MLQVVLTAILMNSEFKEVRAPILWPEPLQYCVAHVATEISAEYPSGLERYWQFDCLRKDGDWIEFTKRRIIKI